jgi:hypothetical protein
LEGRVAEAVKYYQRYLETNPPDAAQMIKRLDQLAATPPKPPQEPPPPESRNDALVAQRPAEGQLPNVDGGIAVQLPGHSPCPSEQIVGALATRLRHSEIRVGEAMTKEDVKLSLALSKGRWSIEILAPGQPPLSRPLAVQEDDCLALSEASALITERYLESINWLSSPGEVSPLPPPPRWQASLALSAGAAVGLTGVTPMAQLDLGARYDGWALELSGAYLGWGQIDLLSSTQPASEFQHTGAVALWVSRRSELGPGALRAGLAPGLELYWVGSSTTAVATPNPLPHPGLVFAPLPFIGAQTGYDFNLTAGLTIGVRLQVRAHLGTLSFVTEGYSPHLATPPVTGDLSVVVSSLLF